MKSTMGASPMEVEGQVPISDIVAERLIREKKAYHQAMESSSSSFDYEDINIYYVLSAKFLNQWKQLSRYTESDLTLRPSIGTLPQAYNMNILQKSGAGAYELKRGLQEGTDYQIVSPGVMDVFKAYKGEKIERYSYKLNGRKLVQVYSLEFSYIILSQVVIQSLDNRKESLAVAKATFSRYLPVRQLKKYMLQVYDKKYRDNAKEVKIWKMDNDYNLKKYEQMLKTLAKPQKINKYRINDPHATLCDTDDAMVDALGITSDDVIIVEVKLYSGDWVFGQGDMEIMCEGCRKYKVCPVECGCKKVRYCTKDCQRDDVRYHRNQCTLADQEELKQDIDFTFTKYSKKGVCGLQNLGNTCFMNSCLQCLSNTPALTEYFLNKRFYQEINKNNPIGTKGKITMKYAKMIQGLWAGTSESYNPYVLKSAIADFQPTFMGYNQHDSQELLSYLLDGLHQDLNRVINKPYVQGVDHKGQSDQVFAFESWKNFLMRNQSIIVDLFMGQFKSKVVCPDCKFESITFDPFSSVSLPIPTKEKLILDVFVFFSNYRESPKKISLDTELRDIRSWKEKVSKITKLDRESFDFYILSFKGESQQFTQKCDVEKLIRMVTRDKAQLFVVEHSQEQLQIPTSQKGLVYARISVLKDTYLGNKLQSFTFQRPFYWKIPGLTGREVYFRIFKFLFKTTISVHYRLSLTTLSSHESAIKYFDKYYQSPTQKPFQIYVLSEPVSSKSIVKTEIKYDREELVNLNTNLESLLVDQGGRLKEVIFDVRVSKSLRSDLQKLNSYEDLDKYNKRKMNSEESVEEVSLADCLKEFEKTETLEPGNEWRCPKCKDFKLAFKSMSLYKTPKFLIIQLKRFKQKNSYQKSKLNTLVQYPFNLQLNQYLQNKTLPQAYFASQNPSVNTRQCSSYQLYAVSNHMGGMGGGHYTAYAKNNGKWFDFNDSSVYPVTEDRVVSSSGYLLFYKRRDE